MPTNINGLISGTPTTDGTYQFTVQVTDSVGGSATQAYTIMIGPVLAITTISLPDGVLGGTYSQQLAATNGTTPYAWSIASGALPGGLQLNGATGVISGTPTSRWNFHLRRSGHRCRAGRCAQDLEHQNPAC